MTFILTPQLDFKRYATAKRVESGKGLPLLFHCDRFAASVEVRVLNEVGIRMDTRANLTPINTP